jgi:hypothetical protein
MVEIEQHRQHVHIGQGEGTADEMAGLGHGAVEHRELRLQLRQSALDDRAVRAPVRGARKEVSAHIGPRHQHIEMRVDDRDPLLGSRAFGWIMRHQWRALESVVDVEANRAGFGECEVTVTQRRNLAQRMNRIDLSGVRHDRDEGVRHALLVASDAADPDVIALGCADDLKLWHGCSLSMVFSIETTREECQNDKAELFFRATTPCHSDQS